MKKKKFALQNAVDKTYWYGFYSNKKWTDDILEARLFDSMSEMRDYVENNFSEFEDVVLVIVKLLV